MALLAQGQRLSPTTTWRTQFHDAATGQVPEPPPPGPPIPPAPPPLCRRRESGKGKESESDQKSVRTDGLTPACRRSTDGLTPVCPRKGVLPTFSFCLDHSSSLAGLASSGRPRSEQESAGPGARRPYGDAGATQVEARSMIHHCRRTVGVVSFFHLHTRLCALSSSAINMQTKKKKVIMAGGEDGTDATAAVAARENVLNINIGQITHAAASPCVAVPPTSRARQCSH
jgi:hypothetical protein